MSDINEYEPNISSKQIQWILDKATPDIVLSKQSITLDSDSLTDTFTITTNSDGNLSVSSNDISVATVSLSGNTATVEALVNGSCTITVNVAENSNYITGTKTLSVDVQLVSTILNDNSWNTIKAQAQSGEASSLWNVGDTKEVVLNGNTTNSSNATKSFNNYSCYATILGFDHNASFETNGEHSIHFILAKDSTGKDISFYPYRMNESNATSGGWNSSKMKNTTMVEFKNCLPAELQDVLKNVTKYSDNVGNYANSGNITATTEQVFLLSEFEVHGGIAYANSYEQYKQAQYAYYKDGNSKVKYQDVNVQADYNYWWNRSVCYYSSPASRFCIVHPGGFAYGEYASVGWGISPAFVV